MTQYLKIIDSRVNTTANKLAWKVERVEFCSRIKHHVTLQKVVKHKLNDAGIKILEWPGNSPDMNPIENVWAVLKHKIRENPPTTKKELIRKVLDLWYKDEYIHTICRECAQSMVTRIRTLSAAKGGHTNCLLYLLHIHLLYVLYVIFDPEHFFNVS